MPSIWTGTVAELKRLSEAGNLLSLLSSNFSKRYGRPAASERGAWEKSIPALLAVLREPQFDVLNAIIELQMPVGCERADVVLLGGTQKDKRAYILELKQWSAASIVSSGTFVVVPGMGEHQHPSVQVLNYRGKLRLFHSLANQFHFRCGVFAHNMTSEVALKVSGNEFQEVVLQAPIFTADQSASLADSIARHLLPCDLSDDTSKLFSEAKYEQTEHLWDIIRLHANDIATRAIAALADNGIGLTEEQENVVEEVLGTVGRGISATFIVDGGPGSGKTLVAVTILLRAAQKRLRCALAIRNNRLQAILRECFDSSYPGISGMLMYFEVPQRQAGLGDAGFDGQFDLVLCDEAQRMRQRSMSRVIGRAPVSAIFLDEGQRLNPPEEGTIKAFGSAARENQRSLIFKHLTAAIRCRGGQPYHEWVEKLISGNPPVELAINQSDWSTEYLFEASPTIDDLVHRLSGLKGDSKGNRVALVASFTESPGSISSRTAPENLRVGFPLTSGLDIYKMSAFAIRWLMQPREYVQFWMKGKSNELSQVASIYGAQGFESDYVGLIWGRDFIYRSGQWCLGDAGTCFDSIDGLVTGKKHRKWSSEALELLRNRYRIFLTRGIKGTLVFCEDDETRSHLLRSTAVRAIAAVSE